jgi:hypothetical protein
MVRLSTLAVKTSRIMPLVSLASRWIEAGGLADLGRLDLLPGLVQGLELALEDFAGQLSPTVG